MAGASDQLILQLGSGGVDEVEIAKAGTAPPGAKGVDMALAGGLIVTLAESRQLVEQVVEAVRNWLDRHRERSLILEMDGDRIEVTGISSGVTGPLLPVGRSVDFVADRNGRLFLGINDGGLVTNRGAFEAAVTVDR